jgi:hydroxymethylpyrimidine kinase/phosphomethylpyrimidine kinase
MVAKGGRPLLSEEARETLIRELLPLAMVFTPNIPEAEALTGRRITSLESMKKAAEAIHKRGARNVIVKGGHLEGDAVDLLYDGRKFHTLSAPRIATKHSHGTGCTFASAIATGLAQGSSFFEASKQAKAYVTEAIRFGLAIGGGQGPVNHAAPLLRQCERICCADELKGTRAGIKEGRAPAGKTLTSAKTLKKKQRI